MTTTVKFSQFVVGPPPIVAGDIVVGLRNGTNTQFLYMPEQNVYFEVVQDDHGFILGQIVRLNGSIYVLAQADTFDDSCAVGIVTSVIDVNTFVITMFGYINPNLSLTPGALYYLDPAIPGAMTLTAPSTYGQILKLVFIAATDTMGYFLNYEGTVVGTSGSGGVVVEVSQTAHGFTAGQAVRLSGDTYVLALADNVVDAEAVGVVSLVIDANTFLLSLAGEITGLSGLTAGNVYYVSQTTPGLLTDSEPTTTGQIEKPLMIANTTTSGFIFNLRGRIIPEAAIATNLEFSGNSIISTNTNGNIDLAPNGTGIVTSEASINLYNDSPLRWYNTANTFYNAFVADPTLSSSTTWQLPQTDGTSGQVLGTNGSGVLSFINGGGGGSGSSLTDTITQTAHGFTVGQVVGLSGTTYVLSKADTATDAEAVGIVSSVVDANHFVLTTSGLITGLSGLTAGDPYYVSPTTAGLLTSTEPTTPGEIEKPILIANSTTSGYVINYRGRIIPNAAVSTNLELSGNSLISTNTNGNVDIAPNGTGIVTVESSLNMYNDSPIRWYNTANTFYNAFVANSTLSSSTTWTLPTADGTSGQFLQTNGSEVLAFASVTGGSVSYSPATPGNWYPSVPTTVGGALDEVAATGVMGPFSAGSVIYSNGTELTQDNTSLNWNDTNGTFHVLQPSSVATVQPVVVITSDPSGSHGHGAHLAIDGNPAGGGTIFRTDDTSTNDAWIQITGGDHTTTGGGTIYVNGNVASESGAPGCVQTTFGLSTSSFQMYDYTQSILLFQLNNAGVLQLPELQASSAIGTDASHNIVPITSVIGGWTVVTTNTAMIAGQGYITNSASQIILTLPATITVGSAFQVVNMNTGGFSIAQNSGQQVQVGVDKTTVGTGGSVSSQDNGDAINLVCNVANTNLIATPGTIGSLLIT